MKEEENSKHLFLYIPEEENHLHPECNEKLDQTERLQLKNKAFHLIQKLGLHEKINDPWNVANIIRYYQHQGVDCKKFISTLKSLNTNLKGYECLISPDKKIVSAYLELVHNFEAAKK